MEQGGVAHDRLEIHLVTLDGVGLAVGGAELEQLVDVDSQHPAHVVKATSTLGRPRHLDGAGDGDGAFDALEGGVEHEIGLIRDVGRGDGQTGEG